MGESIKSSGGATHHMTSQREPGVDVAAIRTARRIPQSGSAPQAVDVDTLHANRFDVDLVAELAESFTGTVRLVGPDYLDSTASGLRGRDRDHPGRFLPGREGSVIDAVTNPTGALAGALLGHGLNSPIRPAHVTKSTAPATPQAATVTVRTPVIIPARGGSKGIPRKNLQPLAGKPLIAWTIAQISRIRSSNTPWVEG